MSTQKPAHKIFISISFTTAKTKKQSRISFNWLMDRKTVVPPDSETLFITKMK